MLGIVGCGYVADLYVQTLRDTGLPVLGLADRDPDRLRRFARHYGLPARWSDDVRIVLNLTSVDSHYEVTRQHLEEGRHVYTEKPLAPNLAQARELVELAQSRGLQLASAPCTLLGEAAQTVQAALSQLGKVRLAYAELDDGPLYRMPDWKSASGTPWPRADEFRHGCVLEHAAYHVSWLVAFFGRVVEVTSFVTTLREGAQFGVGCLEFENGAVARLTCSAYPPRDRSLSIHGDSGSLTVQDCWDFGSPITLHRPSIPRPQKVPLVRKPGPHKLDFARGVVELARAVQTGVPSKLGGRFALHVNEVVLALSQGVSLRL